MFYNAPWLENLGKKIAEQNRPSLHSRDFFKTLSGWVKAKRKKNTELLNQEAKQVSNLIDSVFGSLQSVDDKDVERYLSWQFGVFGTGTFGQEVSWNWLDLAVNTGIEDYLQTYSCFYPFLSIMTCLKPNFVCFYRANTKVSPNLDRPETLSCS